MTLCYVTLAKLSTKSRSNLQLHLIDTPYFILSLISYVEHVCLQSEMNQGSPSPETNGGNQARIEYKAPPNMKKPRREGRLAEKNSGKENMCKAIKETDPYEAYARTDKTRGQQQLLKRPEWRTQRPGKAFIPASERYPAALQKHRQENRMRRQMELMNLVERNTTSRTPQQAIPPRSGNPSHIQRCSNSTNQNVSKFGISLIWSL